MAGRWEKRWSHRAPFYFKPSGYGSTSSNVVFDAEGRYICGHVHADIGALFAAAPTMYATLHQIAEAMSDDDPRKDLINRVLARADDIDGVVTLPPPRSD
jgi:hypothetical protein